MPDEGVRLIDFPDGGQVKPNTRLVAETNGSCTHDIDAVAYYMSRALRMDVSRFGAVGDGVTDDTAAIQAAIYAAGQAGGDVEFEAKPYKITQTLFVGDGTAAKVSSYGGVRLLGKGVPPMPPQFMTGYLVTDTRCTRLLWAGDLGGTMLHIAGPMHGWAVHNIFFDGAGGPDFGGKADVGMVVVSAMGGDCRNLSFRGCRDGSIYSTATNPPAGVSNADALHNSYENICIACAWANGVKGIVLTGTLSANSDYNQFRNVAIVLPSDPVAAPSAYGVYFQSCDSNVFDGLHFFNGHAACIAVVFDYTVNADWPAGNVITSADWGGLTGPVQNKGTPSTTARPNYIYGLIETNGGLVPIGVKNLVTETGIVASLDQTGQTAAKPATVLYPVAPRSGLYRINYNLLVTGGSASGGNVTLTLSWLDGSGTPSFTTPSVPNGPGNYQSGAIVVRIGKFGTLSYSVQTPGITGNVTTQYALSLALERLL